MAIPDYQTILLPLLKFLGDGEMKSSSETSEKLADEFRLSEEERKALLQSGQQSIFVNRIAWAKVYLKKAGLIESPKRGCYRITELGEKVLKENPLKIDNAFLTQFEDFNRFWTRQHAVRKKGDETELGPDLSNDKTPEEFLEIGYQKIQSDLISEILKNIKTCSSTFFERLVVELLVKMGYGGSLSDAGKTVGKSGDGGIDGIIKEDRLGLDIIYIQAKRWENTVHRPEIQKFAGALQGQRAKKGIFITTSDFSNGAKDFVSSIESKIVLIDGEQLAKFMIDYDIGVSSVATYEIKRIDSDYFLEE
ncbi:MAG: restriction endonuclease [Candidatus Zhuqueibacterota bacterium]